MTETFRVSRRVEFHETDLAGIAHFSNFFRWMEWAEREYLRSRGLSFRIVWEGQVLGFPRVSATCDYLSPVTFDEVIDVIVRVEKLGRKSITYAFEFFQDGKIVARGKVSSVCCLVGPERLESIEIPASLRSLLQE